MAGRNSQLPQEMHEAIIDHLHDDNQSLKACSLVCKAWTHPARLHLFSTFTVKWPLQPAVFPFVRHLRITMLDSESGTPTLDKVIPLLVGFHRIVSLIVDLSWLPLTIAHAKSWSILGKNLSGVVSLSLMRFVYTDVPSFAQAICTFPCLRELSLFGVLYMPIPGQSSATTFRPSGHLHTLELQGECVATVLEWLLSLPVHPALRIVRLHSVQNKDLAVLNQFIAAIGNDLESITLSFYPLDWTPDSIDITPLKRLRRIQLGGDPAHPNRWVTQILSQISSIQMEHVEFRLFPTPEVVDFDLSGCLEWSEVDAILQRSTFSQLRSVEVRFLGNTAPGLILPRSFSAQVMERLPLCRARGILFCVG